MNAAGSRRRAPLWERLSTRRATVEAVVDGCAWAVALSLATLLRFDFDLGQIHLLEAASMIPLAIEAQIVSGHAIGLYGRRWRLGSFDEVHALAKAAGLTTALVLCLDLLLRVRAVPLSSAVAAGPIALVLMAGARYAARQHRQRRLRPTGVDATRLLVFGAGEGGAQVITAMLRDPTSPYYPVGLLDDDPAKRHLRIMGVRVLGTRRRIAEVAASQGAEALLIAIPSADTHLVAELTELAEEAGLSVKVLPPVRDLFAGGVGVSDIRDIDVADLLGRHQVETDIGSIAGYLTGRRVLVTGAGGSIGSELCRQISRLAPAELLMLDRSEAGLHAVQLSIEGRALLDSDNLLLADVRDADLVRRLFELHRPEVVFHAAALKHLPLLERAPEEAVKTNVLGTLAVLEASAATGVERFVNISTDKAADPVSVLGHSKRAGERLTAHFAAETGRPFLSVRFGNVLGSSGSVLTTFTSQLETGGPLTVTHPEVTRFFMTVEEAVDLVVQAGAIGRPGEALVLDMGDPVRIADVAERLAARAKRPTRVVFTGLRPGEKLHESLFAGDEADHRPIHPSISHVPVPPLHPLELPEVEAAIGAAAGRRLRSVHPRTRGPRHLAPPTVSSAVVVVGARPNFVKAKPVIDALEDRGVAVTLVHTGQHYDSTMSGVFFEELGIRRPDCSLAVGSGSHAEQTAGVMVAFEPLLDQIGPDVAVVAGDVNSTVACALVAAKGGVPVAHVEAGLRSWDWSMPEEVNRVVTDGVSDYLLAPSPDAVANLRAEGCPDGQVHLVGNVMIDALLANLERARARPVLADLDLSVGRYGVVTLHRPANVDHPGVLADLVHTLGILATDCTLVFPVHPRTRSALERVGVPAGIRLLEPLGYLDFLALEASARLVLTDSGGVQEETTVLGVPCLTLRDNTERPITVSEGTNTVVGRDARRILAEARRVLCDGVPHRCPALWDGRAGQRIADILLSGGVAGDRSEAGEELLRQPVGTASA